MKKTVRSRSRAGPNVATDLKIQRWAALAGRWKLSGAQALYLGPEEQDTRLPLGLTIGEQAFRNGIVRTRFKLSRLKDTAGGLVVGYQSLTAPYVIAQLGGWGKAYSIAEYRPGVRWVSITDGGLLANLDVTAEHDLRV